MKKANPLATAIALLFMVLLLAGLAARFWASGKAYEFTGPTHITAGEEHVYLFASGDIYQLTHAGEMQGLLPRETTGLVDDPIDLVALPGARLLIARQQPASIRLCETGSWICRPVVPAATTLIQRQFKILPLAPDWLLTDASGDSLWRMGEVGGEAEKQLPGGTLAGPNGLAFDEGGTLWVADSDHRRIVELLPEEGGGYRVGREHSAMNHLTVGQRHYPMMLAVMPDGPAGSKLWLTQAADFSKPYSDLVVYDSEEGAQSIVALPEGAYATDITVVNEDVLVTDLEQFTVYRVNSRTLQVEAFGDGPFRRQMARLREGRAYYNHLGSWSLAAVIGFGLMAILAAFLATPGDRRWTKPRPVFDLANAPEQVPRTSGIHWLERDPKIDRSLKWLEHLGFVVLILTVTGALGLYAWARFQAGADPGEAVNAKLNELGMVLLIAGLLMAAMVPLIRFSTRAMKRRLGTDGKRLYIRLAEGRELAVDPSQLSYTDRLVLYRQYTLPLLGGRQQPLYIQGEVETWLGPLLRHSRKLTATEAVKHQWKHLQGHLFWWLAGAIVFGLVLVALTLITG